MDKLIKFLEGRIKEHKKLYDEAYRDFWEGYHDGIIDLCQDLKHKLENGKLFD